MKNFKRFAAIPQGLAVITLAITVAFATSVAFADADPPSRVARLNYLSGEVSVQPGGVNDWVGAVMNRPLTTADRVWTDKNARAELGLGGSTMRLNAETSMTLTNVSDQMVQVELDQGTVNLHIRHLYDGEVFEFDTPNLAFTILKNGDYRFDVDPNAGTTYVTVWNGEGEATGQGPGVKLHRGQQASFTNGTSLQNQIYPAPDRDGFDDWCQVRTQREDHADSYRYVSPDMEGAADLDQYGAWQPTPQYGAVWVPAVAPGWAPYHYGHWVWVAPWGWTWVDDAPWGYAPAHYGRWVFYNGFWGWSPGPPVVAVVRPVYAPALVGWVGGPHFGVSVSFGGGGAVGWFPLGWGEPYVPAYAVSRNYFQQVNVTNTHITNITNVTNNYYINNNTTVVNNNLNNIHYANQNVAGAVTAVPQRAFTNSLPVVKSAVAVSPSELKAASFTTTAPVAPQKASVLGVNAGKSAAAPPQSAVARTVVTRSAPPPKPVPFEAKQAELAKNPGRPLDAETESNIRQTIHTPAAEASTANHGAASNNMSEPHPANTPVTANKPGIPAATSTPAAANTPARTVPRPPQAAQTSTPSQPKAARVYDETNMPSSSDEPKTASAPSTPARNVPRPPQTSSRPAVTDSVFDRSAQSAPHVQTTSRSGSVMDRAAEPGEHNAPRPTQPDPIYQPKAPHEDQKPAAKPSSTHTQTSHSEPKEHSH
jgi:FecR protein